MFSALGKFWSTLFTVFDTVERASNSLNEITTRLKEALGLIDVRVLDHIIAGSSGTSSMAESGLL